MKNWPFDQNENVEAVTTKFVMKNNYPVLLVSHYLFDRSWGFFCGTTNKSEDCMLVSMKEIIDHDKTLLSIAHLEPGMCASRDDKNSDWVITKEEDE
jgi:hypothetical protein